jgi:hypothetical protein
MEKTPLEVAKEKCRVRSTHAPDPCPECKAPLGEWQPVIVNPGLDSEHKHPTNRERCCTECEFTEEHNSAHDVPDRPGE